MSVGDHAVLANSPAIQSFCERWDAPNADEAMVAAMGELRHLAGQAVPPVGLAKVLPRISAKTVRSKMNTRGRLQAASDGWIIRVPHQTPWRIARFTIAHELSHILLFDAVSGDGALVEELRSDGELWWAVERLCDRGATELLLPNADIRGLVGQGLPRNAAEAHRLLDRYMVSVSVVMRRLCDLEENRSYTTWEHAPHGAKPADWRVTNAYSRLPKNTYIPQHLSARSRLLPNVVEEASRTGFSFAETGTLTAGNQRHTGEMFAVNPTLRDESQPLPTFDGMVITESYAPTIHLLIDHKSVGPISRRTKFG